MASHSAANLRKRSEASIATPRGRDILKNPNTNPFEMFQAD